MPSNSSKPCGGHGSGGPSVVLKPAAKFDSNILQTFSNESFQDSPFFQDATTHSVDLRYSRSAHRRYEGYKTKTIVCSTPSSSIACPCWWKGTRKKRWKGAHPLYTVVQGILLVESPKLQSHSIWPNTST
jgi:hypothetical protein